MLLCISLLVFGMLAWLMPQTYSNKLDTILDERTQNFISELEQVPFSNSGGLFDQFICAYQLHARPHKSHTATVCPKGFAGSKYALD